MERKVTQEERALLQHVSMFGSDGYPVRKLRRGWVWGTDSVKGPPVVFGTKAEAVAAFESFLDILRLALGAEAQGRAIAELQVRGLSDDEVQQHVAAAYARQLA